MEGMSLIFNVSQGIPPPPANFPTCKDFSMSKDNFNSMMEKNRQCALDGKCLGTKGHNTNSSAPKVSYHEVEITMIMVLMMKIDDDGNDDDGVDDGINDGGGGGTDDDDVMWCL